MDFIVEGFKEVEAKFILAGADEQTVKDTIQKYRDLVNKNQIQGVERNIDWWGKNKTFQEFSDYIELKSVVPTKTQTKRSKNVGRSITLHEDDNWLIVIPLDKDASCFHGKNSDWCTTKRDQPHFKEYFHDKNIILIYCLNKQTGGMWAIANYRNVYEPELDDEDNPIDPINFPVDANGREIDYELFNQQDQLLTPQQFQQQTGLDPFRLLDLSNAQAERDQPIYQAQRDYQDRKNQTYRKIKMAVKRDPEIEKNLLIMDDPGYSLEYIKKLSSRKIDLSDLPERILVSAASGDAGGREESILKYFPDAPEKIKMLSIKHQYSAIKDLINNGVKPTDSQLLQANLGLMMIRDENFNLLHDNGLITPAIENVLKHSERGIDRLLSVGYEFSDKDVESALMKKREEGGSSYDLPAHVSTAAKLIAASGYWPSEAAFKNIADTEVFYDSRSFKPYYSSVEEVEAQVIEKLHDKIQSNNKDIERYSKAIAEKKSTIQTLEQRISDLQQEISQTKTYAIYQMKDEIKRHESWIPRYQKEIESYEEKLGRSEDENLNIFKILRKYNKI